MQEDEGELRSNNHRLGVIYEGTFYEFGSVEFNNLLLIEGRDETKEETLLGLVSKVVKADDLINKN